MVTIKAKILLCNNWNYKFEGLDFAKTHGFNKIAIEKDYEQVYEENVRLYVNPSKSKKLKILEGFWEKFNLNRPADYKNRSLSTSDIICFEQDGDKEYWYCDRVSWVKVED